jgi:peroxiredoxin
MPWLVDLYKQYHEQGLEIVGVSMDDDGEEQRVADFVREIKINYPIVLGNHTIGDAFGGTQFLPKTFFIDRQGNISSTTTGMKNKSEFETTIKELLTSAN